MTTTDTVDMTAPPPAPTRRLRRSRSDRIGAGVAGGLGEYFELDPVLFRVLFATAAFFGGAGVLAYLLAWAAIPEEGTEHAPIDGWVTSLRRHRVPFWLVAAGAAFLFWLIAFSWWAPGPFVPVIVVVLILIAVLGRRGGRLGQAPPAAPAPPVVLTKDSPGTAAPAAPTTPGAPTAPMAPTEPAGHAPASWVQDTRQWIDASRTARRERLRRAMPIQIGTLVTLVITMVVLGLVDAAHGIPLSTYFWFAAAILATGLLLGIVLRRAAWTLAGLLVPALIGVVAFAGAHVSLRDGIGQRVWRPAGLPAAEYRLAVGQGVLDLRGLPPLTGPRTVRIDMATGQLRILTPTTLNLTVHAQVRFGAITEDGVAYDDGTLRSNGVGVDRTIGPPARASGAPLTIEVHLAEGNVDLRHT